MKRKIEPAMVEFLDGKLASNGLAHDAIARKDARLLFRFALEACVGIRETGGNNNGPMVRLIQETVGTADREPWCMSLVQTGLAYAELRTGVLSPIAMSEHCLTVWNVTPISQRVQTMPGPGAIIIWRHGRTTSGHTGITIGPVKNGKFPAVEGNTESGIAGGKVVRDGGGVYLTQRNMSGNGSMQIVGFLKPF
jgi:hypothetical protein